MDETLNCEASAVKEEPGVCKKEPLGRCDDLVNEFVDYTMVSVPLSASEIAEMDTTAFTDSIIESTSKDVDNCKQTEVADPSPAAAVDVVESMDVDDGHTEHTDLPDTSLIENDSAPTISSTCDIATTSTATEIPTSSQADSSEVCVDTVDTTEKENDVVMLLSDSEDEDNMKADVPANRVVKEVRILNDEVTLEVIKPSANKKVETVTKSTENAAATNNDNSVIMLDDSPENSEAELQNKKDSSKPKSSDARGS